MKKILLTAVVAFISIHSFSQARTTLAEFQKVMQPGVEIEVPFAEKTVAKAIEDKMQKKGYKGKETKGFIMYKTVLSEEFKGATFDLYFKVDRRSRKEKDNSTVVLLVSPGYEKFIGDSTGTAVVQNAKTFLNNLLPVINAYDLELQINDQDDASKKAAKKYNSLVEDGKDLVKRKERLEKDIEENIKKQAEQKAEAEKQKQIFETLKGKRKQ